MTSEELTLALREARVATNALRVVRIGRVIRRSDRYLVRASMRPHPVATLHRVSCLPRGTLVTEPIPIEWFKAPRHYRQIYLRPDPSRWRPHTPPDPRTARPGNRQLVEVPPRQRIFAGIAGLVSGTPPRMRLGILPQYWPRPLKILRRQHSGSLAGSARRVQGAMRRFFRAYNYDVSEMQIDHVQDIGWHGPDAVSNLWPADTEMNQAANRSYGQAVWYDRAGVAVRSNPGHLHAPNFFFQIRLITL